MGKQQDREKIVQEIKIAADLYRKHLVGKRFLYVMGRPSMGLTVQIRQHMRLSRRLLGKRITILFR
jgi:hypothetical protein